MASNALSFIRNDGEAFALALPARAADFTYIGYDSNPTPIRGSGGFMIHESYGPAGELTPIAEVGPDGVVDVKWLVATPIESWFTASSPNFLGWKQVDNWSVFNYITKVDGILHSVDLSDGDGTARGFSPRVSPDEQYLFWAANTPTSISVKRHAFATGVTTTIKTFLKTLYFQCNVERISPDNSEVVGILFLADGSYTQISYRLQMDGSMITIGPSAYIGTWRGSRGHDGVGANLCYGVGSLSGNPYQTIFYAPAIGFEIATSLAAGLWGVEWNSDGNIGAVLTGTDELAAVTDIVGQPNSEVMTVVTNFPEGWIPYDTPVLNQDGTVWWGVAVPVGTDFNSDYDYYPQRLYRWDRATNQFDTFDTGRNPTVWYSSDNGDMAAGQLGDQSVFYIFGSPPQPWEYSEVAYEEVFTGPGIVDYETYENLNGLGYMDTHVSSDGASWVGVYYASELVHVLTTDGLVSLGWFDFMMRTLPMEGSEYFLEIDFLFDEFGDAIKYPQPQALGIWVGQTQAAIDIGDWGYYSPSLNVSIGIDATNDAWYECGYDLGHGMMAEANGVLPGVFTGTGTATLRIELQDKFVFFSMNGQVFWAGPTATSDMGPFVGFHGGDLTTIKAMRYGYKSEGQTAVPDFWQDFVITKELP